VDRRLGRFTARQGPYRHALRVDKLINMVWKIGPGQAFDLWVDDIQMLECP
jgi:hypothetical protein